MKYSLEFDGAPNSVNSPNLVFSNCAQEVVGKEHSERHCVQMDEESKNELTQIENFVHHQAKEFQ